MSTLSASFDEIVETYEFSDPPFGGKSPEEIEKETGVKLEILDTEKDPWIQAYPIRVSGTSAAISAFFRQYHFGRWGVS